MNFCYENMFPQVLVEEVFVITPPTLMEEASESKKATLVN